VRNGVDALDGCGDRAGVADVPPHTLRCRVEVGRSAGVGEGVEGVQDSDLVAALDEGVDYVRADEAGAADDEYTRPLPFGRAHQGVLTPT
jgi:hypothetical protein